jgi:cytochrome b involved in lipid metabolism
MSQSFTHAEVAAHKIPTDLWIIISGEVYNITEFQNKHPGGEKSKVFRSISPCSNEITTESMLTCAVLQSVAGKDATKQFTKLHNDRILKASQYKDLCIGTVKLDKTSAASLKEGGFWGLLRRRKTEPAIA